MIKDFKNIYDGLNRSSSICDSKGVKVICSDKLSDEKGIIHGFTTRIGGVSPAPFDTLNFSFTRADSADNIKKNLHILSEACGPDFNSLAIVNHEHGSKVIRIDKSDCGRGVIREALPFSDGLITNDREVTLVTCHADCGAVFLYDKKNHAIGLAHAGWKGTLKRIGQKLVEGMTREFGSDPSDMIAALGPCICFDCFEVDHALGEEFEKEFGYPGISKPGREGKAYVDIEAALVIQLIEAGIAPDRLSAMHRCTFENRELFFSYRRDGKGTGAMVAFMRLN